MRTSNCSQSRSHSQSGRRAWLLTMPALLLFLGIFAYCNQSNSDEAPSLTEDEMRQRSLEVFASFQEKLKGELLSAIQAGGPANAIEVCKTVSPEMEASTSADQPYKLVRISDKPRNPEHAPDEFEAEILQLWEAQQANGQQPGVVSQATDAGFRVMKPIMIEGALCLQCHGNPAEMDPAVTAKLNEMYPEDQATGYAVGDLRGAFSMTWQK